MYAARAAVSAAVTITRAGLVVVVGGGTVTLAAAAATLRRSLGRSSWRFRCGEYSEWSVAVAVVVGNNCTFDSGINFDGRMSSFSCCNPIDVVIIDACMGALITLLFVIGDC